MLARPSSSCNSSSPWLSALLQPAPGACVIHSPSSRMQTRSRQLVTSLQTFTAGIMGNKTHPIPLQLTQPPSKQCDDHSGSSPLEFGARASPTSLSVIRPLNTLAAAKGPSLGTAQKSRCQKDRNSGVMQVFGAGGKVQSSRKREYGPTVQSRDKNTSRAAAAITPASSAFASWALGRQHNSMPSVRSIRHPNTPSRTGNKMASERGGGETQSHGCNDITVGEDKRQALS